MALAALGPGPPPGHGEPKCRPVAPEAKLLLQLKTELDHLLMDETPLKPFLYYYSNKSCHYTSDPPVCVPLRCISCDSVGRILFPPATLGPRVPLWVAVVIGKLCLGSLICPRA